MPVAVFSVPMACRWDECKDLKMLHSNMYQFLRWLLAAPQTQPGDKVFWMIVHLQHHKQCSLQAITQLKESDLKIYK